MSRVDIVVDIGMLSKKSSSQTIQISAVMFEIKSGREIISFDRVIAIDENERMNITMGALKHWLKNNPSLILDVLDREGVTHKQAVVDFTDWMTLFEDTPTYLWGNGILFDNKIVQKQCELFDIEYPIHYENDRDIRTIVELASEKMNISPKEYLATFDDSCLTKYDAHHNCLFQARVISDAWNRLTRKEC